jgi:carbamoyl-phosphate synthase small subunit
MREEMNLERAILGLADGTVFKGVGVGSGIRVGEVVFNTSMYGYQEILTDPSYAGQLITFTYPHIGNVGCNPDDDESDRMFAGGMICRDFTKRVSNFRAKTSLSEYICKRGSVAISKIDTRRLVIHLRDHGAQMGAIGVGSGVNPDDLVDAARAAGSMEGKDYVPEVSTKKAYSWREGTWNFQTGRYKKHSQEHQLNRPHLVVIDCGVKRNILRLLVDVGFRVTVVPAQESHEAIAARNPDALFLSNGPGDPATVHYVVKTVQSFLGRVPMFGICLGHQMLGQAFGGKTYKLKFGHRGGNHPVKDLTTGKVEITVQNHGFAVDESSLGKEVKITHLNLNDGTVEGLSRPDLGVFSVQYHPESSPGPHDAEYLFRRFFEWVVNPSIRA